jgi:hypothetical protein
MVTKIQENSERLSSKDFSGMIVPFLYFFGLSLASLILLVILRRPYDLKLVLHHFLALPFHVTGLPELYLLIILPLVYALYVHKRLKIGSIILVSSTIFYLIIFIISAPRLEMSGIPMMLFIPFFLTMGLLGLFLRFFKKIESKTIRISLLILPYLIVLILISVNIAPAIKNPLDYCETAKASDICYSRFAAKENSPAICFKIRSKTTRDSCLKNLESEIATLGSINFCKEGSNDENDRCYLYFAKSNVDVSLCEKIIGDQDYDNCYFDLAQLTEDASLCDKITRVKNNNRNICLSNLGR